MSAPVSCFLRRRIAPVIVSATLLSSLAFGYVRLVTLDANPAAFIRTDNQRIRIYLNSSVVPGAQSSLSGKAVTVITPGSDPVAGVRNALATWNGVGAAIKFLPLESTTIKIDSQDSINVVNIASTADDVSFLNGAVAATANVPNPVDQLINGIQVAKGVLLDSDIVISPAYSFSTDGSTDYDLQSVMTHELGHLLGANHTGVLAGVMFQFNTRKRFLTDDELQFANGVYPSSASPASGTISGKITADGAPVPSAVLTASDKSTGITVGGLAGTDGSYSISAPPGSYQVFTSPLNGLLLNGALPLNFYLSQDQLNAALAAKFQATLAAGPVTVTAGTSSSADIAATAGASTLGTPIVSASNVNGSPFALGAFGGPVTIPSGQAVDFILAGAGYDASLKDSNFTIYGKGVAVRTGSVRIDNNNSYNGFKFLRVTLDVDAVSSPTVASLMITVNGNSLAFPGLFLVVPPTPTFTSKGVVSSASFLGANGDGAVSPGGIYTLFDLPNTPNLGPTPFVQNGPYDVYGNLATTLGGVTVSFDGIPAPMFLAFGGQLNFQVPFEVAGKTSTKVVVNYLGSPSAAITVPVLAVQPALFTSCIDGKTLCAINLKDLTFNSASNPAAKGDFVEVYGTGVGKTTAYTVLTGTGAPAPPPGFTGNFTFSIGGSPTAPALFGGWTPTAVGLAQWDLQIPASSATGPVPIAVTDASGAASQPGVTIYVK
jgi:uncharacterized protein (TIGR03437 family)